MKRDRIPFMVLFGMLVGSPGLWASITPAQATVETPASAAIWIGRAQEFEEFLTSAEIVRIEDIPIGVTKPERAYFSEGGLVESMSFKRIKPGRYKGFWESYRSDIAAYELDKLLGLDMIPPTVEKRVEGDLGAAVMWVKPVKNFKELGGPPHPPSTHAARWNRQLVKAKMFDVLIYNRDPNLGNWLVDPAWNLILIDHTRAFTAEKKWAHTLKRVDAELWERMKTLTLEQLTPVLEKWLPRGQIEAIVERRDMMQKEIDRLVAANGEGAVLMK
jgi:hypothetical protein